MLEETRKALTGTDLLIFFGVLTFIGILAGKTLIESIAVWLLVFGGLFVLLGLVFGIMMLFNT